MPAPIQPGNLYAWATGPNNAALTWENNDAYDSIALESKRTSEPASAWSVVTTTIAGTATGTTVYLSPDGLSYDFRVRGYTSLGGYSDYSNEATCQLTLLTPSGLSGRASSATEIELTFNCASIGCDGYKIYKDGAYLDSIPASSKSYTATGLTAETYYEFYVTAYNSAVESGVSNTVRIFTADPPAACVGVGATAVSSSRIQLAWTNPADNETGVYVYRSTDGINYSKIATLGANASSYAATGLSSNTLYYFYVTNYNASGESNASNVATASTFAAIAQPTNLTVVPLSDTKNDLFFDDNSSEEDGHSLERRQTGYTVEKISDPGMESWNPASTSTSWTASGTYTWTAPAGVTAIQVELWGGGGGGGADDSGNGAGGGGGGAYSKSTAVPVTPGNTYQVVVGARGSAGIGASGSDGSAGADSTFGTTTVVAKGGAGGKSGSGTRAGGAGGAAASGTGDVKYSGGTGGNGYAGPTGGGGGGASSAGTAVNGNNGGNGGDNTAGTAGSAPTGGGSGGAGALPDNSASTGVGYGGGGGGGGAYNSTKTNGGYGYGGKAVITYNTTPTDLVSWTEATTGSSTVSQSTDAEAGSYSAKLSIDASNNGVIIYEDKTLGAATACRLSIWYKYQTAGKTCHFRVRNSGSNVYLKSDGTWQASATQIELPNATVWTHFTLDFTTHASYADYRFALGAMTGAGYAMTSSYILFDECSIKVEASFAEIKLLEPNRFCYRDTGLTKATEYEYRVRAKQGASYSAYSDTVAATTMTDPSVPTDPAAAAESDSTIRLTWTEPDDDTVAGYKIERGTDGVAFTEIAVVSAGIAEYLDRGRSPSTIYYYRIRAYSIVGNTAYTSTVNATTLSAYVESKFERLMKSTDNVVYLAELNPKVEMMGFSATAGKSYTYEVAFAERRSSVAQTYQNGEALTEQDSVANVEANAGSFYFDVWSRTLYVHTIDGDDPAGYIIEAGVWLYFTNQKSEADPMTFTVDGSPRDYLPLLKSFPEISQAMAVYYQSGSSYASGEIKFANSIYFGDGYFWDSLFARYIWENRPVRVLAGRADFDYADFETIFSGWIEDRSISDDDATFVLGDPRKIINATMPPNKFTTDVYVNLPTAAVGKPIPICYGDVENVTPVLIDATNKVFKLADHRIKAVVSCALNGTALAEGTDYFVDYQRGLLVFHRDDVAFGASDKLVVNLQGRVNAADELIESGAEVFLDLCRSFMGLSVAELDVDSIYWTKSEMDFDLEMYLNREQNDGSATIVRTIEHSLQAATFMTGDGRLGLQPLTDDAPAGVKYLNGDQISGFGRSYLMGSAFDWIIVRYAENPSAQSFSSESYDYAALRYRKRLQKPPLEVDTYLTSQADAQTLLAAITDWIDVDRVYFNAAGDLMTAHPGEIFYLSRDRDFNESGSSNMVKMRIISIAKDVAGRKVKVVAEAA